MKKLFLSVLSVAALCSLSAYVWGVRTHKPLMYADKTIFPSQVLGSDGLVGLSLHDNGNGTNSLNVNITGGGSGGGAMTVADGADVALGSTTDAAVGDATGTLNSHARQIAKLLGGTLTENQTQLGGTAIDTNSGNKSAGTQRVVLATDQPQLTNALKVDGSGVTQPVSMTSWSSFPLTTLLTTTQTVSGSAGTFGGYALMNLNSSPAYIQVFDTTGAVTLGTTVPSQIFVIPANSTAANGIAANVEFGRGITMANGIKIAATTTATGSTTVSTGLSGTIFYK